MNKRNLVIAVDFDGTIVDDEWPNIGKLKPHCKEVLLSLKREHNCDIIIWTCRDFNTGELQKAVEFLKINGIEYDSVNCNCPNIQKLWTHSPDCRKVFADIYIDDRSYHFSCGLDNLDWLEIKQNVLKFKKKCDCYFN